METPIKKTADKKAYMREYMKKRYDSDKAKSCDLRKAYYYKKKYNLSTDEVKQYGENLHLIVKAKKLIQEIREKCPQHLDALKL